MNALLIFLILLATGFFIVSTLRLALHRTFTLKEWMIAVGATSVSALILYGILAMSAFSRLSDTQLINGKITDKVREKVSCEHSYQCHCYTTCSGGKVRSCTTHCQTCYEHLYDIDWFFQTTIGKLYIDRVNRQGTEMPPHWERAKISDYVVKSQGYQNYLLVPNNGILTDRTDLVQKYYNSLPKYPAIYQEYLSNRVVTAKYSLPGIESWNQKLSEALKDLGPKKQVNVVVVITSVTDTNFFYALQTLWTGGKKNDVVLLISAKPDGTINWARSMAHSKSSAITTNIDSDMVAVKQLNRDVILDIVLKNVNDYYSRISFKDYEYLANNMPPSPTTILVCIIFQILFAFGLTYFFHRTTDFE